MTAEPAASTESCGYFSTRESVGRRPGTLASLVRGVSAAGCRGSESARRHRITVGGSRAFDGDRPSPSAVGRSNGWRTRPYDRGPWQGMATIDPCRDPPCNGAILAALVGMAVGIAPVGRSTGIVVGPFAVQAGTGPFSPQGWYAPVVGLTFAVWLLAVSIAAGWPRRTAGHGRLTARPRTGSPGTALGGAVAGSQLTMPKLDSERCWRRVDWQRERSPR